MQTECWRMLSRPTTESSGRKRALSILLVLVACVEIIFTSGAIFGFSSLNLILQSDGIYHELCENDSISAAVGVEGQSVSSQLERSILSSHAKSTRPSAGSFPASLKESGEGAGRNDSTVATSEGMCPAQSDRFSLLFTVASSIITPSFIVVGAFMDKRGPQRTHTLFGSIFSLGVLCLVAGAAFTASSRPLPIDFYFIGAVVIAFSGPGLFLPFFHLANLFPGREGLVHSLLNTCFDDSVLAFFVLEMLSSSLSLPSLSLFIGYAVFCLVFVIGGLFLVPPRSYQVGRPPSLFVPCSQRKVPRGPLGGGRDRELQPVEEGEDGQDDKTVTIVVEGEGEVLRDGNRKWREMRRNRVEGDERKKRLIRKESSVFRRLRGGLIGFRAFCRRMFSPLFVLATVYHCIAVLRFAFFLGFVAFEAEGVVRAELQSRAAIADGNLSSLETTKELTEGIALLVRVFNAVILFSPCVVPLIGYILDKKGVASALIFTHCLLTCFNTLLLPLSLPIPLPSVSNGSSSATSEFFLPPPAGRVLLIGSFALFGLSRACYYATMTRFVGEEENPTIEIHVVKRRISSRPAIFSFSLPFFFPFLLLLSSVSFVFLNPFCCCLVSQMSTSALKTSDESSG